MQSKRASLNKSVGRSFAALTRKLLLSSLKNKVGMFAPLCNILYVFSIQIRPKAERLDIDKVDWPSFYSTASSYNSWLVPLPLRMGRGRHNKVGGLPPRDMGNIELLKVC